MRIKTDFPGANLVVETIESDGSGGITVRVHQDRSTSTTWWFYWCFRVEGAAGKNVEFHFTDGDVFAALGPCYSEDGRDWRWLESEVVRLGESEYSFRHTFAPDVDSAYFSFCIPYVETHLREFLHDKPQVQRSVLTTSEQGREVELLTLPSRSQKYFVPIITRSHACETMGSYVMEGMIEGWLHEPDAEFLRENVTLHCVPFVDKDGVEAGDQGKNRIPYDHNRDYLDEPIYNSTRAWMQCLKEWGVRMPLAFDLHCPHIKGWREEKLFFVGQPQPWQARLDTFMQILQDTQQGELRFDGYSFPFGQTWNAGAPGGFGIYIREHFPAALPCALETPYARSNGQAMSAAGARGFGRDMARAMSFYLQQLEAA